MTDEPIIPEEQLAAIKEQLKAQVLEELKDEQTRKLEEQRKRREHEREQHKQYVEKMKQSPDPWVEVVGWVETEQGVNVELDWNDAFVDYLRINGITGVDDEQTVQRWITLLLRDMADQLDETMSEQVQSEFEG